MKMKYFNKVASFGFMVAAALLVIVGGCVGYVERPSGGNVYVEPVFVEVDDYVYYPHYQMYYGSRSHHYYYQEGRSWVSHPAPRGVSVDVLLSTPSVRVDFHDRPAPHHAQVIQTYPKHWSPPGADHGRKEGQKEDKKR